MSKITGFVLLLGGLGLGLLLSAWPSARAQDTAHAPGQDLLCRVFATDPSRSDGARFNTGDATEEVGQWVQSQREDGWQPLSADFEMGVKGNGFPVAYTQVCLTRAPMGSAGLP